MTKKILDSFSRFPIELCRVENGSVGLRPKLPNRRSFDVILNSNGKVNGAAEKGSKADANGMSMRSSTKSISLISGFKGKHVKVYSIPKNTPVPTGLVLLLEEDHHYSLQPIDEMTLDQLDAKLQHFLDALANETKESFLSRKAGGPSSSKTGGPSSSKTGKPPSSKKGKPSSST